MSNSESIERVLGINLEDLQWQDLALCGGVRTNLFYEEYESDVTKANMIDQMCLSCPVVKTCLSQGVENGEWGVWGSVYLTGGKPDEKKNEHKTQEVWDELRDRLGE